MFNKIIGAKYYNIEGNYSQDEIRSPRDLVGYGSHIASMVAGNLAKSATLLGYALGSLIPWRSFVNTHCCMLVINWLQR